MSARRTRRRASGFTLIELIAALAIGSVVLAGLAGLIRNVGLSFELGTRNVGNAERLLLAVERLAGDFASARNLQKTVGENAQAIFIGGSRKVAFVAAGGVTAGPAGEEVVVLEVETAEGLTRLVRRRAPWLGARTALAEIKPRDPVILLEGRLQIAFAYAGRALVWKDRWLEAPDLPRFVRLTLRDGATGAPVFGPLVFEIRADAPPACARPDATPACIVSSGPAPAPPAPAPGSARP